MEGCRKWLKVTFKMRFGSHRFYGELDIVCNTLLYICYLCDELDRRVNEVTINTKEESHLYEKGIHSKR